MSRRIKILFTLSVLLNIVFIGVAVGTVYKMSQKWDNHLDRKIGHLSPEMQDKIRASLWESRDEIRDLIQEGRQAKESMKDAINAEEFDVAAYDAASQQLIDLRAKAMLLRTNKTKEFIKDLPVSERRQMAGHLMRHHGRSKGCDDFKKFGADEQRVERFERSEPRGEPEDKSPEANSEPTDYDLIPMPE